MTSFTDYLQTVRTVEARASRPKQAFLPSWEEWLTFALVGVVFLSVVNSIESAEWVPGMPSLLLPALVALLAGFTLGRSRIPELVAHFLAMLTGGAIVFSQLMAYATGDTLGERWGDLRLRVGDFIEVVRANGISNDTLPFVLLVLALTFVAAYFSAWAIFRWHNAWLGLIPGGIALLTNISYLPGQPAAAFLFFLFGAVLLVMRMHLLNQIQDWQQTKTPYPQYLSVSYLNATFWVSVVLLGLVWVVPVADKSNLFSQFWDRVVQPLEDKTTDWGRFFVGVASKKPLGLHDFGGTLSFQSGPSLSNAEVGRITGEAPTRGDIAALRGAVYDIYTRSGWKVAQQDERDLPATNVGPVGIGADPNNPLRKQVTLEIQSSQESDVLLSLGLPVAFNVPSTAEVASGDDTDVGAVHASDSLQPGERYLATGSVATATDKQLQSLNDPPPPAITSRYLQLPADLPPRVKNLAIQLTQDNATIYDKVEAIELYLRTIPQVNSLPPPPPGKDAIDYFLFEARQGFFDYHASAMAVLLRAAGIPSRVVTGFVLDEFDQTTGQYVIRESNAYTWPEVYFSGLGWTAFTPSPDRPAVARNEQRSRGGSNVPLDREADPGDLPLGNGPRGGVFVEPQDRNPIEQDTATPESSTNPLWFVLGGLLGVVVLGGVGARLAWERGLGGLPYAGRAWEKTVRLASWAKLGPRPSQTPSEYAGDLNRRLPKAPEIRTLADAYVRSRFGRKEAVDETAAERKQVDQAWKSVRGKLIARIFRWR